MTTQPPSHEQTPAPVGFVYLVVFLTALTGFVREAVLAAHFGSGRETDAYFFAYGLVQLVHDVVFSGSLSASVIPLLRPLTLEKPWETLLVRARFVSTLAALVALGATLLALGGLFVFPALTGWFAPDMNDATRALTFSYGACLVWLLPANALLTLLTLVLHAHRRFRLAASVYLGGNVLFIFVLLFLAPVFGDLALPVASLAGPLAMVPLLARKVRRMGLLVRGAFDFSPAFFRSFFRLAGPSLATLGLGGIFGLVMAAHMMLRGYVAFFGAGGISATGYAFRLYEAPVSILVNPAATLVFPAAVGLWALGRQADFAALCRRILLWGLILVVPVALVTYAGAELVVWALLQRGSFDANAMAQTAEALRGFAPAIVFEAVLVVFFRLFYALERPYVPVVASTVALAGLAALLYGLGADSLYGVTVMLSSAFALAALVLVGEMRRSYGPAVWPDFSSLGRWGVAMMLAGGAAFLLDGWLGAGLGARAAALALFLAAYPVLAMVFMPRQRAELRGALKGFIYKSKG